MLKHAFVISAHANEDQLKKLIESLSFGDVYLHIDKKSESLYTSLQAFYDKDAHVTLIENRISVNWSGFSQVQATLELFKVVKQSCKNYDYVHFISGQDLLLMKHEELDQFILSKGKDKQFIEVVDIGSLKWRLNRYSFFRENPKNRTLLYRIMDNFIRLVQLPIIHRHNFDGYDLYKGGQWLSITHDCMLYVLDQVDRFDFCSKFKYTACSDEHFFQILLMNSRYKDDVEKLNYRYVVFSGLNASPNVLTMKDYPLFMNQNYIFARKFDSNVDKEVINRVLCHVQGGTK